MVAARKNSDQLRFVEVTVRNTFRYDIPEVLNLVDEAITDAVEEGGGEVSYITLDLSGILENLDA